MLYEKMDNASRRPVPHRLPAGRLRGERGRPELLLHSQHHLLRLRRAAPTPVPVQMAKAVKVNATDGLNIRSQASTDSEILGLADNGDMLPLLVEEEKDGWYQIEYQGKPAYVSAEYATVQEVTLEEYNQLRTGGDTSSASSSSETSSTATSTTSETSSASETSSSTETTSTSEPSSSSSDPAGDLQDGE